MTDICRMDNTIHWPILQELDPDFRDKVCLFMVVGWEGAGVLILTQDGVPYWYGEMRFANQCKHATKPERLNVGNVSQQTVISEMAQSYDHVLLLDKRGQIYAIGMNDRGQLGQNCTDMDECRFEPVPIDSQDCQFVSIRCGFDFSLALTKNGKVWTWGGNDYCQAGVPPPTDAIPSPIPLLELNTLRVVSVACGGRHAVALTDQGDVYSWGCNEQNQLGHQNNDYYKCSSTPKRMDFAYTVKRIAAGFCHTLLLTEGGDVYQCGDGQLDIEPGLTKVTGLPIISQITAHFLTKLSIAMTPGRDCFVWSQHPNGQTPLKLPSFYSSIESPLAFFTAHRSMPYSVRVKGHGTSQLELNQLQQPEKEAVNRVVSRLKHMFDNQESSDVQFMVEDNVVYAHKPVLQITSSYLHRMVMAESGIHHVSPNTPTTTTHSKRTTTNPSDPTMISSNLQTAHTHPQSLTDPSCIKITITDYCYPVFHAYLRFLYTGVFNPSPDILSSLFELSHQYQDSDLQQLCLTQIRSLICVENCCQYYQLANRYQLPELERQLVTFIADNPLPVFRTDAYRSMDLALFKKLTVAIGDIQK